MPTPEDPRAKELWLQHAAGWVLFRDVRTYARKKLAPNLSLEAREAALQAIDDALYGLMMVADGVPAPLRNDTHHVSLAVVAKLRDRTTLDVVEQLDLRDGDEACMGYHLWRRDDFGSAVTGPPTNG